MTLKVGIIGGSGLGKAVFFEGGQTVPAQNCWGTPSAPLQQGRIDGVAVVQLARHGVEHTLPPGRVNYRANIQALKDAGCTCILATTAVGSLRSDIRPGDLVILDQFIDFTRQRAMTFFETFAPHEPRHVSMADPFDARLRAVLLEAASSLDLRHHPVGTVVTIEGPRFSTRAESRMFRILGADVINMSVATEAALANELGLPYAAVAMSTDYDCWKEDAEPVSWEAVLSVFERNVDNVTRLLLRAIPALKQ